MAIFNCYVSSPEGSYQVFQAYYIDTSEIVTPNSLSQNTWLRLSSIDYLGKNIRGICLTYVLFITITLW